MRGNEQAWIRKANHVARCDSGIVDNDARRLGSLVRSSCMSVHGVADP